MEALLYILGVLLAVVGVGVSIGLHEIGHMVPAKRFGVRVTQYMIGFGPTLWSRKGAETEYGVKAVPLGGYIRMIGMYPPPVGAPTGTAGRGTTGRFQALAEQARETAWEEVARGDEHRVFYRLSAPRKVVVMLAGPSMNLVIAAIMFTVLLLGIGLPTASTTVASVFPCIPASMATEQAARAALSGAEPVSAEVCGSGSLPAPAHEAGLVAGDRVTSIDGTPVEQWSDLTDVTRSSPGRRVELGVATATGERTLTMTLGTAYRAALDADGLPTDRVVATGYLGVVPRADYVAQPITAVPTMMWDVSMRSARALLSLPARVVELAQDMIAGNDRDPNSPVSVVGIGRISGEVAAAEDPIRSKAAVLVSLMASLNLFLFLFNLLPLLPLDGGHVAGAIWEGLRRQVAKVRGRPDPGPVDVSKALPLAYAVAVVLVVLSSVVILADVVNPIRLYG